VQHTSFGHLVCSCSIVLALDHPFLVNSKSFLQKERSFVGPLIATPILAHLESGHIWTHGLQDLMLCTRKNPEMVLDLATYVRGNGPSVFAQRYCVPALPGLGTLLSGSLDLPAFGDCGGTCRKNGSQNVGIWSPWLDPGSGVFLTLIFLTGLTVELAFNC